MQMSKRAQMGSGFTLFWTTIVILAILLVFSLLSFFVRPLVAKSYDDIVIKKINLDDYMAGYRSTFRAIAEYEGSPEPFVLSRYFPTRGLHDYEGTLEEGKSLEKEYILDVCDEVQDAEVIFVTGVFDDENPDSWVNYSREQIEGFGSKACLRQWEYLRSVDDELSGNYEFVFSKIAQKNADICCYGR